MSSRLTRPATCRICKGFFDLFKGQKNYLCPTCRTPEKMAAAGYGWWDIMQEANVSEKRARDAVFPKRLEKAS